TLNSRLNFRLCMTTSGLIKHPISVSIKPAAAQNVKLNLSCLGIIVWLKTPRRCRDERDL
ncbi:hypothetical protein ABIB74_007810, partial [Bradyrhizobium sp. F1.6.2]|uniref:hypothetical protein n=1 Tax=Bradyrhizobium sp. F1.6.2 TaxID=3156357 RepID=UPI0033937488